MKQLFALLFFVTIASCKKEYQPENKIKADVAYLADDKLEGRQTGTEGEQIAAAYIAKRFEELGLSPKGTDGFYQAFTFVPKTSPHDEVKYTSESTDSSVVGTNVLAYIDNKSDNTIVIGAHYDHLGYGGDGSLYRDDKTSIHNGADDNASGVAIMLNLASRLKHTNTNNNYLFMAFSGEEIGLLGSNYFCKKRHG